MHILEQIVVVGLLSFALSATAAESYNANVCGTLSRKAEDGHAIVGVDYGQQAMPIPNQSEHFATKRLASSIVIQRLFAVRSPTNTVIVTARFLSCVHRALAIRVRTSFLDTYNAPTEPPSAWQTVFLDPGVTGSYSEKSVSTGPTRYVIEIAPE